MKYIHTIATSDSSGGAGTQIDLKVINRLNYWGISSISGLTIQSFDKLYEIEKVNPDFFLKQILFNYKKYKISSTKIGAICGFENLKSLIKGLNQIQPKNIVLDTVFSPTRGDSFLSLDAIKYFKKNILNRIDILTPNKFELELISGKKIFSAEEGITRAKKISKKYNIAIALTGGHFSEIKKDKLTDFLIKKDKVFKNEKNKSDLKYSHGTGCIFSSALTCYLVDNELFTAFKKASDFTTDFITELDKNFR